jgi:hypothetical protein
MDPQQTKLDRQGAFLLAALARGHDPDLARKFDTLFYELTWRHLRDNHATLGARVARRLKTKGSVIPYIQERELDDVAHDATSRALHRVRNGAARFDPSRGKVTAWVVIAAEFAYVEVAQEVAKARRSEELTFVDPADIAEIAGPAMSTEEFVIGRLDDAQALAEAAELLTVEQFTLIRARINGGYSRAELALAVFGDASAVKRVDYLFECAKKALAEAWADKRPGSGTSSAGFKVSDGADDKED